MAISELDLPTGVVAHSLADAKRMAEVMADGVAKVLDYAVHTHGIASLAVSGGRSPIPFFEALSRRELDWSRVQITLADERWVPPSDEASNEALVRRYLLQGPAAQAQFLGLYSPADTLAEAARHAAEALTGLAQPIDVLVLGMGEDGHTASLFPGSDNLAHALRDDCPEPCVPMRAPSAPHERLSLSYPILASARTQYLAIQGLAKLDTLRDALAADALQMPIRAFMHSPLEIYWCP
ncbi:6-phosphogluconolactonase [Stutzerimonas balearica]|jgi:6-phosphogluconolactonase|uniref:6-phosphogluconolactonase n=1 Tax=Stutzerimonas balearica TaxID=74829 RepID=A0A9X7V5T7_9GAMM|nr:6-phosphogluconolactonase [Stutzerimonas balearica]HCW95205.1 6-phosphogluconolactonase [Pseudomonas sp.]MBC7198886.1 6-phosphogluconolactonase [Stutzerimonas balearica]MBD3736045.1 6-phosphogluconolactonase [Stutzerimonas balearica]MCF6756296.1 6-phosphogluconolactonase [Stutzerimonas balearica]QIJ01482.1 6-phosphogluconolactonase [Stutzerimonas balearica]